MDSSLVPVLTNNFVGFHKSLLFERHRRPHVYLHYVDDTFPLFDSNDDIEAFRIQLNSPQFTLVVESGILFGRNSGSEGRFIQYFVNLKLPSQCQKSQTLDDRVLACVT